MRHLIGFILAIALGAALFFAAGWGFTHMTSLTAHGINLTGRTGLTALAALGGTGLFPGILLAVRALSPPGTRLPGPVLPPRGAPLGRGAPPAPRGGPRHGP